MDLKRKELADDPLPDINKNREFSADRAESR
jgi:hypothetical protein